MPTIRIPKEAFISLMNMDKDGYCLLELSNAQAEEVRGQLGDAQYPFKNGETYYYIPDIERREGGIGHSVWDKTETDFFRLRLGNAFPTREAAEMHRLRLESLAEGSRKKKANGKWNWSFREKKAEEIFLPTKENWVMISPDFDTMEEATEWGAKYAKAWESLYE